MSVDRAWHAWRANPAIFSQTPAQALAAEVARITGSEFFEETVSALYAQAEIQLFRNRLDLLTGVRWERTDDRGEGSLFEPNAVFLRNASGAFSRTAAGARIRRPGSVRWGSVRPLGVSPLGVSPLGVSP